MPSPARSRCLQVRDELERRLAELEPYPDLLSATERRLRDASDLLRQYEQRHLANVEHITQLTSKVTHLTDGALLVTNTPRRCSRSRLAFSIRVTIQSLIQYILALGQNGRNVRWPRALTSSLPVSLFCACSAGLQWRNEGGRVREERESLFST